MIPKKKGRRDPPNKRMKKIVALMLSAFLLLFATLPVYADATRVVTLGADLTDEQKQTMWDYFGTSADQVVVETVNNTEEREYLSGIAPEEQIGTRTYSCAYIEPTSSGGINVKTANLNWVTADMISSALSTAGVENANVIAAAPFAVSGTGALTGILKSYQAATNTEVSAEKQEAANQEIVTTTDIADSLTNQGADETDAKNEASEVVNEAKQELLEAKKDGEVTDEQLQNIVNTVGANLSDTDRAALLTLLQKINAIDYSDSEIKSALDNIDTTLNKLVNGVTEQNNIFTNIWNTVKGWFGGGSILDKTDDTALGASAVITDTSQTLSESLNAAKNSSWWDNVVNWFKGLFGGNKTETSETTNTVDESSQNDSATITEPTEDTTTTTQDEATNTGGTTETTDTSDISSQPDSVQTENADDSGNQDQSQNVTEETGTEVVYY